MSVLGIDGFDYCNYTQAGRKYYESGGRQSLIVDGRQPFSAGRGGGYAFDCFNTAFGLNYRSRTYGQFKTWIVGADVMIQSGTDTEPGLFFYRFESGDSNPDGTNDLTQLTVAYGTDRRLQFWSGAGNGSRVPGLATLIASTSYALPVNQFVYLELKITFGMGGSIEAWADDTKILTATGLAIGHTGFVQDPDRLTFAFQNFGTHGITIDNHYVADTSGPVNNDRLGPCRVTAIFPAADFVSTQWSRNHGAGNWACMDDPGGLAGEDDDATELTGSDGDLDLYATTKIACYGKILAVALNACAHGIAGSGSIDLVYQPGRSAGDRVTVAAGLPLPPAYTSSDLIVSPSIVQGVLNSSPINGGIWRDFDIENGYWGIRSGGATKATQFFLEKIVSLRPQHYDCGRGSYAY